MRKLAFIFICLALFNCISEPIEVLEQNQELILKSVNYSLVDSPDNCPGLVADFDSQGKITEVYYECEGNTTSFRTYSYSDSGLITGFTGYSNFTYNENDVLIRRSGGTDTGSSYFDFSYNNNTMIAQGFYNGVQNDWYTTFEFEDDTYKKLISIKRNDTSNIDEIIYRVSYQYDGNNPVEILFERKDSNDIILEPKRQITITYDDKINPYKIGLPENAYLANATVLAYDVEYNIAYTADNNIVSIIINDFANNFTNTYSNIYTYNTNMFPLEAIFIVNGEPFRNDIFEYYQ